MRRRRPLSGEATRAGANPSSGTWRERLRAAASRLGIELSDGQARAFELYLEALLDWNQRVNLTSITDPDQVAALHFLDSLSCLAAAPFVSGARVADVGSGAGLPGIPLAITRPDLRVALLESVAKKCRFLEHAAGLLSLGSVSVACTRAEHAGRDPTMRETFDIVVSRAVAELAVVAELCLPLVKVGGLGLFMKGPRAEEEVARAGEALSILGGKGEFARELTFPAQGESVRRVIIGVRKLKPTPQRYPRAAGRPARRPLGIDRRKNGG